MEQEWEAAYGDVVETQDVRKLLAGIDTEKLGKISLQQWIDYLLLSTKNAGIKFIPAFETLYVLQGHMPRV